MKKQRINKIILGFGMSAVLTSSVVSPTVLAKQNNFENLLLQEKTTNQNENHFNKNFYTKLENKNLLKSKIKEISKNLLKQGKYKEARKLRKEFKIFGELYKEYRKQNFNFSFV